LGSVDPGRCGENGSRVLAAGSSWISL
jgi:hypothetical protein